MASFAQGNTLGILCSIPTTFCKDKSKYLSRMTTKIFNKKTQLKMRSSSSLLGRILLWIALQARNLNENLEDNL